ncbi:hypothetical protein G352_20991 [Rhodococcus ruber BKS 20-38]|uniref:RES domain-containing protein n=1 Tax=Rhodococcus ruber BKS 20-38 TaxID=1278076 RepID=M2ZEK3_9NOCA|nr:hypothetical protein [Rhodococcus ruber]EME58779.1 hypothetical protein G352_20991 [Rhodococcus ruber BKS 20-38]
MAETRFGALNPRKRDADADRAGWSRWDTPGRTIYGGTTAVAAFAEVIEYIDPAPAQSPMTDLFDDVESTDALTLDGQIATELPAECGAMPYKSISKGWREMRTLYELALPPDGWFVDVTGAYSVATIGHDLAAFLRGHGIEQLTLSELTDSRQERKAVTTGIAEWIRHEVVLDDGSVPHGIYYLSKWGADMAAWAMWLRRRDDGLGADPLSVVEELPIGVHTRPLVEAARLRGMTVY